MANTNFVGTFGTPSGNYFTDIQSAVDATLENGLVLVSNGVYNTGGALMPYGSQELTNRIVIRNNITIRSISGAQSTIIVGCKGVNGRAVRMEKGLIIDSVFVSAINNNWRL